jgi:hypothetical protein
MGLMDLGDRKLQCHLKKGVVVGRYKRVEVCEGEESRE